MSDWELVENNAPTQSDWEIAEQPEEKVENESFLDKLPRNIGIGLSKLGHSTLNIPYDVAKNIEQQGIGFGQVMNKTLPMEKYVGQNRLPDNKSYMQQLAEQFNQSHNVPEQYKNEDWAKSFAERIPHQKEYDFAEMLGQKGEPTLADKIIQNVIGYAPELYGGAQLGIAGAKKAIGLGESLLNKIKSPKIKLEELEKQANKLNNAMSKRKQNVNELNDEFNRNLKEHQEGLEQKQASVNERLENEFPIKSEEETLKNLSEASQRTRKDLEEQFNKRYNAFNESKFGQTQVKEPFDFHQIESELDSIPGLSEKTKEMGSNISRKTIESKDVLGNKKINTKEAQSGKVSDYIDFSKQLRDMAYEYTKAAKNAPYGEAKSYRAAAKKLREVKSQVESKIKNTIGDDAYGHYENINKDYGNLIGAIKESNTLSNAAYGREVSSNLFDKLLQPKNEQLRNYLYQQPDYIKAIREQIIQGNKHPLSYTKPVSKIQANQSKLNLLTDSQKSALREQNNLFKENEKLQNISKNAKKPETLTVAEEKEIRNFSPKANDFLNRIAHEKSISKQMEEEAKALGINKDELKKQWERRKLYMGLAGVYTIPASLGKIYNTITK